MLDLPKKVIGNNKQLPICNELTAADFVAFCQGGNHELQRKIRKYPNKEEVLILK